MQYGLGTTRTMDCPKQMVGRVIGKGGETIKQLQRNTGANIQIDQSVNPCKITATGSTQCVQNAVRVIQEIISEESFGGGGPGGAYGRGGGTLSLSTPPAFLHRTVFVCAPVCRMMYTLL